MMFGGRTPLYGAREGIRERRRQGDGNLRRMSGLVFGTRVATPSGWRSAEGLVAGDWVLTFDNGMQRVTQVDHAPVWTGERRCPREFWMLDVPAGLCGNHAYLRLMPEQGVMVESDAAEMLLGDPFSIVPARALEVLPDVTRVPVDAQNMCVTLRFATAQVAFSEAGAMYLCPGSGDITDASEGDDGYRALPIEEARVIVTGLTRPAAQRTAGCCPAA